MSRLKPSLIVFFFALLMLVGMTSIAQTLDELLNDDKVRLRVWIEPEENIISRQQVNLQIEVATDKWFSGGMKIRHFEVDDAIVLQREKFAVNSTRNEGEKSWTVQQWTLAVYPLRDGVFDVPAIPLQLSVAGENLEAIVGETNTEPFSFIATLPEQVTASDSWIATDRFDIKDSFDKAPDELSPGDALIRTIKMSADNLPAMMLPEVTLDVIPGIAIYTKPPQLTDKVNRGDYIAQRTQTITYVFEKTGEYLLPKQSYFWWNLESQSYESVELDEYKFTITSITNKDAPGEQTSHSIDENMFARWITLFENAAVLVLLVLGVWIVVRRYRARHKSKTVEPPAMTEAGLRKQFEKACAQDDKEKALALFYQWLDFYGDETFTGSVRERLNRMEQDELLTEFNAVLQSIYAFEKNKAVDLKSFSSQFVSEIQNNEHQTKLGFLSVDLKLN